MEIDFSVVETERLSCVGVIVALWVLWEAEYRALFLLPFSVLEQNLRQSIA